MVNKWLQVKCYIQSLSKRGHNFGHHILKARIVRAISRLEDWGHVLGSFRLHLIKQGLQIVTFLLPKLNLRHWLRICSCQFFCEVFTQHLISLNWTIIRLIHSSLTNFRTWYDHFSMIASILFFSVVLTSFPLDSRALISSASMFWMPCLYRYELIVCMPSWQIWQFLTGGNGRSVWPLIKPLIWSTTVCSSWTCLLMSGK